MSERRKVNKTVQKGAIRSFDKENMNKGSPLFMNCLDDNTDREKGLVTLLYKPCFIASDRFTSH